MKTHDEFAKNLRERYEAGITDTPDPWDELTEMEIYDGHNAPYWVYTKESVERARAAVETAHKAEINDLRESNQRNYLGVQALQRELDYAHQVAQELRAEIERLTQERDKYRNGIEAALDSNEATKVLKFRISGLNDELAAVKAERDALKAWKDAMVDLAVVDGIYTAAHENDPRQCLMDIVQWEQRIALDPAVSADASALRDTFKQERDALAATEGGTK